METSNGRQLKFSVSGDNILRVRGLETCIVYKVVHQYSTRNHRDWSRGGGLGG